jgi:hypothetical protein
MRLLICLVQALDLGEHMSRLTSPQYRALMEALLEAFPTLEALESFTRLELGIDLQRVAIGSSLDTIYFRLIQHLEANGRGLALIEALVRLRPHLSSVHVAAAEMRPGYYSSIRNAYERHLTKTPMLDFYKWMTELHVAALRVCKIVVDGKLYRSSGTGFLVGPDLVLTNYHVVEQVIGEHDSAPCRVSIEFEGTGLRAAPDRAAFELAEDKWLVAWSPPHPTDCKFGTVSLATTDQLDFALLRLSSEPGNSRIGGTFAADSAERGWFRLSNTEHISEPGAPLIVLQRPRGSNTMIAIDTAGVVSTNPSRTRVHYRTNTDPGSSGSPCFSLEVSPVLIHQGFVDWPDPDESFNQGVPLGMIWDQIRDSGTTLES